jgi:hypothetical protein
MVAKLRRNFSGAFRAEDLGAGAWRLYQTSPEHIDIFLRGVDGMQALQLLANSFTQVGIEWREGSALITLLADGRIASLDAASALVHEPLPRLYETLPLQRFDAKARRFWGRIFFLVRLPGGRALISALTRRRGG